MTTVQDILNLKDKVIHASLDLATQKSWADITMHDIATHADLNREDVHVIFDDKEAILSAYARQVDLNVAENLMDAFSDQDTQRDKLFDVLMERFDVLNDDRDGVLSILNAVTLNPQQAVVALPNICQSMTRMMDLAGMNAQGWRGAIQLTALSGIYIKTLRDWAGDDSPDMSATMASLDKGLGYLDKINF